MGRWSAGRRDHRPPRPAGRPMPPPRARRSAWPAAGPATLTGSLTEPWLICGDFNTAASSWPGDDRAVVVSPAKLTYPADKPAEPIDYCVASAAFRLDAEVLPGSASDHLPLAHLRTPDPLGRPGDAQTGVRGRASRSRDPSASGGPLAGRAACWPTAHLEAISAELSERRAGARTMARSG